MIEEREKEMGGDESIYIYARQKEATGFKTAFKNMDKVKFHDMRM